MLPGSHKSQFERPVDAFGPFSARNRSTAKQNGLHVRQCTTTSLISTPLPFNCMP
eukprot:COSAG06_NODE_1403_length_9565_cov_3.285231_8_plen_55_part_00